MQWQPWASFWLYSGCRGQISLLFSTCQYYKNLFLRMLAIWTLQACVFCILIFLTWQVKEYGSKQFNDNYFCNLNDGENAQNGQKISCLLLFHCGSHEVRAHQMSGMNVDYQTVLHACSLLNSLLLKYAATLQCKVKLTSFINSILYWHLWFLWKL